MTAEESDDVATLLARSANGDRYFCLVADDDGDIVGFVNGEVKPEDEVVPGRDGEIETLYVAPESRRRGAGSALATAAIKWLQDHDASLIHLETWLHDYTVQNFWVGCGFELASLRMVLSATEDALASHPQATNSDTTLKSTRMMHAHLSDTDLACQSAVYWTGVTHEALVAFAKAQRTGEEYTRKQFLLLCALSESGPTSECQGKTMSEMRASLPISSISEDNLTVEAEGLVQRGWLTKENKDGENKYRITETGCRIIAELLRRGPELRARLHNGIDGADYITTVKVLQQLIRNANSVTG